MVNRITLASPWMDDDELQAAAEVLSSRRLVRGPRIEAFEEETRKVVSVKHAIAVSSGTMAIYAVLRCLGIGDGDEVVVPALSFPAAAECVIMAGANPVFVDVSKRSFNLDPDLLAATLTAGTRAVIAIDQFGVPADYPGIEEVLKGKDVCLIEDSACALGSSMNGKPCGSFGKAAVFSFHPRKIITTGEGGMVLTDDDGLAARVRLLRNHGLDQDGTFTAAGLNLRMGEIEAAIGQGQLKKLDRILRKRRELASIYIRNLDGVLEFQQVPRGGAANYQTFAALLPGDSAGSARDGVIREMAGKEIELQVASFSMPLLRPYSEFARDGKFPVSDRIHNRGLALPLHPLMSGQDVQRVCEALKETLKRPVRRTGPTKNKLM